MSGGVLRLAALAMLAAAAAAQSDAVVLKNSRMEVHILPTGATLQRVLVPGRKKGEMVDVVLGFDEEQSYRNGSNPQMGSTLGRVGGRIAGARFEIDGVEYRTSANAGNDTMHGGEIGWDRRQFSVVDKGEEGNSSWVTLEYQSPGGEMGFPGAVNCTVTYTLRDDEDGEYGRLEYEVKAVTDQPTPVSVYLHPYFNLAGQGSGSVLNHTLVMNSSYLVPYAGQTPVPSGEFAPVAGTIYDFQTPTALGKHVDSPKLEWLGGYDNVWALFGLGADAVGAMQDFQVAAEPQWAAKLLDPESGRGVEFYTTAPAMIVYTGNGLDQPGKDGAQYKAHDGVAIEVGQFPNAVNTPTFPSVVLRPGQEYVNRAAWRFTQDRPAKQPSNAE
ncbi:Aldose 1-epimerase [Chlorella sorokiniana]|uniref:Aldose 1-epimerase n=1 Tax=Chlorella sorokiniana TaxID=3076 RepID=A0A2P6TQ00_CHLSO|nr:Aldose 1-epimerase [Chlorella sorokiniana]|eukprot:PRW56102.1 Aldose 1-epimerase [Chlorella sorokiniana]